MIKSDLLGTLNFGPVDSESETNLDKIFIQTRNFNEFLIPNTALLLGSKGAGKSALFRLFTRYEDSARQMSNGRLDNTFIVSGSGFKDVPEMDDHQLLNSIENRTISAEAAWKIYITYKLLYQLYQNNHICCGTKSKRILQKAGLIRDFRILSFLGKLADMCIGDTPKINQIDFQNISIKLSDHRHVSINDLLNEINTYLGQNGKTVWFLLDKIDELFPHNVTARKQCIEALFVAYFDIVNRFSNIKLKIFLRTDIWNTLSFVNKSHLVDKTTVITWEEETLKQLLLKRAVYSTDVNNYLCSSLLISSWDENVDGCFNLLFPVRVYSGAKEARTLPWIIERCKDGLGGVYPREIITFANSATKYEASIGEGLDVEPTTSKPLISGNSIREAYPEVSEIKVTSYLSEFTLLTEHFHRFSGQTTADFSQKEFHELMAGLKPEGDDMIHQMHDTGVIGYSTGQTLTKESAIFVPRLFRHGLGIVVKGRP